MPDDRWKRLKTGLPPLVPGTWVHYVSINPELNLGTITLSVVPQYNLPNKRWRVVEIKSTDATGESTYLKIVFDRRTTDLRKAKGIILKAPGMPPFVTSLAAAGTTNEKEKNDLVIKVEQSPTLPANVRYLGTETITVPAGSFDTWHYLVRGPDTSGKPISTELWLSTGSRVPVLRIVQMKEGETTLRLESYGKGAKSDLPYAPIPESRTQGMGKEKTK